MRDFKEGVSPFEKLREIECAKCKKKVMTKSRVQKYCYDCSEYMKKRGKG